MRVLIHICEAIRKSNTKGHLNKSQLKALEPSKFLILAWTQGWVYDTTCQTCFYFVFI